MRKENKVKKYRFKRNNYIENEVIKYFAEKHINLSFQGLNETVHTFKNLDDNSQEEAHQLTIDLALWIDYLSSIEVATESKLDFLKLKSDKSKGERIKGEEDGFLEGQIRDYTARRKHLNLFQKNLKANIRYLENAFWLTYKKCKKNVEKLRYTENR